MKIPLLSGGLLLTATIAVSYVVSHGVAAQAPERTAPGAASSTPRLPDGRPDLNGTWIPEGGGRGGQAAVKLPDGSVCVTNCADLLPPAPAAAGRGAPPDLLVRDVAAPVALAARLTSPSTSPSIWPR